MSCQEGDVRAVSLRPRRANLPGVSSSALTVRLYLAAHNGVSYACDVTVPQEPPTVLPSCQVEETVTTVFFRRVTRRWFAAPGMWMPHYISKQVCTVKEGYDQPAEFNLTRLPLYLEHPFECCNACLLKNGTPCASALRRGVNRCF